MVKQVALFGKLSVSTVYRCRGSPQRHGKTCRVLGRNAQDTQSRNVLSAAAAVQGTKCSDEAADALLAKRLASPITSTDIFVSCFEISHFTAKLARKLCRIHGDRPSLTLNASAQPLCSSGSISKFCSSAVSRCLFCAAAVGRRQARSRGHGRQFRSACRRSHRRLSHLVPNGRQLSMAAQCGGRVCWESSAPPGPPANVGRRYCLFARPPFPAPPAFSLKDPPSFHVR